MTTANAVFAALNLGLALLLVCSAARALSRIRPGRDARPLALPVLGGAAFAVMAGAFLFAGIDPSTHDLAATAWHAVHFGLLLGQLLFVQSYRGNRND